MLVYLNLFRGNGNFLFRFPKIESEYTFIKQKPQKQLKNMNRFLVTVIVTIFLMSINNVHANESNKGISVKIEESAEQSKNKVESVKHKRGIVGGYGYPVPTVGLHYQKHSPYARFPGVHRSLGGNYVLTPGTASVHSYSVTYPRAHYSKPVLPPVAHPHVVYHSYPRTYYPTVYANRYPFIPKQVPTSTFPAAPIPAHVHPHSHVHPVIATNPFVVQPQFIPNVLPVSAPAPAVFPQVYPQVPTLMSQNGWIPQLPVFPQASIPQTPIVPQVPQVNRPSLSVLPPLAASGSGNTPNVNSFYLPPRHAGSAQINEHTYSNDELVHADGKAI